MNTIEKKYLLSFLLLIAIIIFVTACMNNKLWSIQKRGEVYSVKFLEKDSKIIINSSNELLCLNMKTGKIEWSNKEISFYNNPVVDTDKIITGAINNKNIYSIDITTGNFFSIYNVDGQVKVIKKEDERIYFVKTKDTSSLLEYIDLKNNNCHEIYHFNQEISYIREPVIIYGENIILSARLKNQKNKLFCINKDTEKLKWQKILSENLSNLNTNLSKFKDSIFVVDNNNSSYVLKELNIETGNIRNEIVLDNVYGTNMSFNNNYVLFEGEKIQIYNFETKKISIFDRKYNQAVLTKNNVIYEYNNEIFIFDIKEKKSKKIYSISNKDLFKMYYFEQYLLLIVAEDLREAFANNKKFTYIFLRII